MCLLEYSMKFNWKCVGSCTLLWSNHVPNIKWKKENCYQYIQLHKFDTAMYSQHRTIHFVSPHKPITNCPKLNRVISAGGNCITTCKTSQTSWLCEAQQGKENYKKNTSILYLIHCSILCNKRTWRNRNDKEVACALWHVPYLQIRFITHHLLRHAQTLSVYTLSQDIYMYIVHLSLFQGKQLFLLNEYLCNISTSPA